MPLDPPTEYTYRPYSEYLSTQKLISNIYMTVCCAHTDIHLIQTLLMFLFFLKSYRRQLYTIVGLNHTIIVSVRRQIK